jgi:hypothetical protein
MLERAPKPTFKSLPVQRVSQSASPAPAAAALVGASALPRFGFASLAVHPPGQSPASTQLRAGAARPPRPNRTGLPDRLKSGVEALSGVSLDGVKVHYNSPRPAQLDAHAYARGREIHLAPGQERHLPHETWHLVQQAQGRVRPTAQLKNGVPLNDHAGLEREADLMGARAASAGPAAGAGGGGAQSGAAERSPGGVAQAMRRTYNSLFNPIKWKKRSTKKKLFSLSGSSSYRADDYPHHSQQPIYGTNKSYITGEGRLLPADEHGDATAADHVHGKPADKSRSPYTSASKSLASVNPYGKHLVEMLPNKSQKLTRKRLLRLIAKSSDPRFAETAYNTTQRNKPLWKPPSKAHRKSAKTIGIDPDKESFTYGERNRINTHADKEELIKGPVDNLRLWKFVNANKLVSGSPFGTGPGKVDLAKLAKKMGRDPRTFHPEGYRYPLQPYELERHAHLERARFLQAEIDQERQEDEDIRTGRKTEDEVEKNRAKLGHVPPVEQRRGGPSPGREAQYEKRMARMRRNLAKDKLKE